MFAEPRSSHISVLGADYFRIRDFEYAQPLYDLAFLLEVEALRAGTEVPKYRTFSLWRAAYRLDGYATAIDKWLDGQISDDSLDHVPSPRIRRYLEQIRSTGSLPEILSMEPERARRILRLRSVRGLGSAGIAELMRNWNSPFSNGDVRSLPGETAFPDSEAVDSSGKIDVMSETWQAAHIVPPLLRFLFQIEAEAGAEYLWKIDGIRDGIESVKAPFVVHCISRTAISLEGRLDAALSVQPFFSRTKSEAKRQLFQHQLGWSFWFEVSATSQTEGKTLARLAKQLDPLTRRRSPFFRGDLHVHTTWSDGNTDLATIAKAMKANGYEYFAVTDHSRSCKVQGGLTPAMWLRQATSLQAQKLACRVLHGIEVDILSNGNLDLPAGLLSGMDLVIASVHVKWSANIETNTVRLIQAIESGLIDIIGHPSSAMVGKPGVPNFCREPAPVDWPRVFRHCETWRVALEFNCFPSRLDLPLKQLRAATAAGCWISLGSDAHALTHLRHLRFGERVIGQVENARVLNHLDFEDLKRWISEARTIRQHLPKSGGELLCVEPFRFRRGRPTIFARLNYKQSLPGGDRVIGLDLTAGRSKATGVAVIDENHVQTTSLVTDDEIVNFISTRKPKIVSIDSPLGFPGGTAEINPAAGIVRVAERELASLGIPAYPALIDSMRDLTLRGVKLKRRIESLPEAPQVIESYPGAAQDILAIPRKQEGLHMLRHGLKDLGLNGPGLATTSHDEMDAITAAVVGRYFQIGQYEAMGILSEAQLIVPKVQPLTFTRAPLICLAGKSGTGKTTIARYLAVFYGFKWIRTRDVIRSMLIDDITAPLKEKVFHRQVQKADITEADLHDFGVVILEKYKQVPLRERLTRLIKECDQPIVLDSIRDTQDIDRHQLPDRSINLWYVQASDARRLQRLKERPGSAPKLGKDENPIDQKTDVLSKEANYRIENQGSLEELRWSVDDELFRVVNLTYTFNSDAIS